MANAWIYAEGGGELPQMLAELGFSPRTVTPGNGLRPLEVDGSGGGSKVPEVAIVCDDVTVCERLRADEDLENVPIVVAVDERALELNGELLEATELIVAPFSPAELEARIARARRAVHGIEHGDIVRSEGLELNLATYQVTVDGAPVDFTYMEYELLKFLVTHPRRAFSREALLSRVWGYDFFGGARTVDVHVRRVRAKLGSHHANKLTTVRRVGYRFDP
jgi:DNA-binding response OmpR family regulator